MSHISFSEMKIWKECSYRHKLEYLDGLRSFEGNEFTAFGTAIHSYCETALVKEVKDPNALFQKEFVKEVEKLLRKDIELDQKLISQMEGQGEGILPEILPAFKDCFGDFKVLKTEEMLYEDIDGHEKKFKGYIDLVIQTEDGKIHIIDHKSCSWGWNMRKKSEPMITYQLTLYKHFWAKKHNIDPENIETHFALLKRTAKKNRVEIFRVTSGPRKTDSALQVLDQALKNIESGRTIKNRLSCNNYCPFHNTENCT